jgi:hypothetical protein
MTRFKPVYTILFICCITLAGTYVYLNLAKWRDKGVIVSDSVSYYTYLPAVFIYHDLSLDFRENPSCPPDVDIRPEKAPNGKKVIKTSMGMAFFYAPLFGIARLYAFIAHTSGSGYTVYDHLIVGFSSILYLFLGLLVLRKILIRYFSEQITCIVILILCLGTNLFFYFTVDTLLAHVPGFLLMNLFVYYTILWHETPRLKYMVILGLCLGFLTLVRPTNILAILLFGLYGVFNTDSLKEKCRLLWNRKAMLLLLPILTFLVFLPQMLYWHMQTGSYLFNSYVGEGFFFSKPHIIPALIGFRKGWLIYTPLMILFFAGLLFVCTKLRVWFFPLLVFYGCITWVMFSWWCWWYGGSFGSRVYIDFYGVFALAIAALVQAVGSVKRKVWKYGLTLFCIAGILLNLMQTFQAKDNIIHYDSMTWEKYRTDFFWFGEELNHNSQLLIHPDYDKAKREGRE